MLYATRFKIDAYIPDYRIRRKELINNSFFIINDDTLIDETTKDHISFLHNMVYELTYQKELLVNYEHIINICLLIINTLSIYETIFDLQFVSYLILKRIYFTYPNFRYKIEDTIAMVMTNICLFKEPVNKT